MYMRVIFRKCAPLAIYGAFLIERDVFTPLHRFVRLAVKFFLQLNECTCTVFHVFHKFHLLIFKKSSPISFILMMNRSEKCCLENLDIMSFAQRLKCRLISRQLFKFYEQTCPENQEIFCLCANGHCV